MGGSRSTTECLGEYSRERFAVDGKGARKGECVCPLVANAISQFFIAAAERDCCFVVKQIPNIGQQRFKKK